MPDTRWRTRWRISVGIFVVLVHFGSGYEELYEITNLSPKSIDSDAPYKNIILETSKLENVEFHIEPSVLPYKDNGNTEDQIDLTVKNYEDQVKDHIIVARSVDRESRSINLDDIPTSNNNEIDNELENHNRRKYYDILPTKTADYLHDRDVILPSEGFGDRLDFNFPGEGLRVPKMRALQNSGSQIRPTAVQNSFATATPNGRQNNAEIQNIITGIVKLLNGNVNVQQANTQLNRGRPMATRINNRGPPRISDVPPLPDFEKPSFVPTKTPPPYPFDRPHHHPNLSEQIQPPSTTPYRPGFHRPSLPPWHRPRPRPTPGRRPSIPIYKTTPRPHEVVVDLSSEKEDEDVFTLNENEGTNEDHENKIHEDKELNATSAENATEVDETIDKTTTPLIEVKEENTTKETTTTTSTTTTGKPTTTTEKATEKTTTTEKATTTTEKLREKPKIDKKKDKLKVTEEKILNKTRNETTELSLESSITEKAVTQSIAVPTPTEGLPSHVPDGNGLENVTEAKPSAINSTPLPTPQSPQGIPYHPYRPRPGIVLDDTDFKPQGLAHRPASVITAPARPPGYGEIFDVTVSAIQGPGGKGGASVHIQNVNPVSGHPDHDDIIVSASGDQGFVSIDGKRTYLNLFGDTSTVHDIQPTRVQRPTQQPTVAPTQLGTGIAIPSDEELPQTPQRRPVQPHSHGRPPPQHQTFRRPQPPVRIDTCIVGDDSTCDQAQNEKCRTEAGISSCHCRPGYARATHRDPCRRVVSLVLNMRVDRLYDRKVVWDSKLADRDSEPYQQLSYEAVRAIDSAFSMTPFSDDFVGGSVNSIHRGDQHHKGVFVNYTILMQETPETVRGAVATDIQKHLLGVIRRRSNNVGASALWVDTPNGSVLPPQDLDECATPDLNDCHKLATCTNTWGGFRCQCPHTTRDTNKGDPTRGGRDCLSCSNSHCNDRGTCNYSNGQPYCSCNSGFYGSTCEVDGEVVGVAVGASLAAALVIALTLAALLSWSRKWSREQKSAGMGSPVFNYMAANTIKTPPVGQPPYQVTLEERMRWAQIAEAMAANHYAQQEQVQTMATRPSSALFGAYPTLPPVPLPRTGLYMGNSHHGTMNTVASRVNTAASHHNLYGYTNHAATESTSSEASSHVQERADLLVPRPKSRARSMHNQNGIYYDVEYENAPEGIYGTKGIPLSTYTVSRGPPFYRT